MGSEMCIRDRAKFITEHPENWKDFIKLDRSRKSFMMGRKSSFLELDRAEEG